MKNLPKSQIFFLGIFLFLLLSLPVAIFLTTQKRPFDIRPRAEITGAANLLLYPSNSTPLAGDVFDVVVSTQLTNGNLRVSGADFKVLYDKNHLTALTVAPAVGGDKPPFTDVLINEREQSYDDQFNYLHVSEIAKKDDDKLSGGVVQLARVQFRAKNSGSATIKFPDNSELQIVGIDLGGPYPTSITEVPSTPTPQPTVPTPTITPGGPTLTPTPTSGVGTPTPTPTYYYPPPPTATPTIVLTPTPTTSSSNGCNRYCKDRTGYGGSCADTYDPYGNCVTGDGLGCNTRYCCCPIPDLCDKTCKQQDYCGGSCQATPVCLGGYRGLGCAGNELCCCTPCPSPADCPDLCRQKGKTGGNCDGMWKADLPNCYLNPYICRDSEVGPVCCCN